MKVPRILLPGTQADPLVVVRSGFWNFNAIGLFDGNEALAVDPGAYPEEIALLASALATRANQESARAIKHVILTHSHHDHIRGWMSFPGAQVTIPRQVADKPEVSRKRILDGKTAIDETMGVNDPDFIYPCPKNASNVHTFEQQTTLQVGSLEVQIHLLLGHSNCSSVVWIPAQKTLLSGDYLVAPGVPYCRWQAKEFEEALQWLRTFCSSNDVQRVIPAHNDIIESNANILAAINLEIDYFHTLRPTCTELHAAGLPIDQAIRVAANTMIPFRESRDHITTRAARRQDRDNAERVLKEC